MKSDEAWRSLVAERVVGKWYLYVARAANGIRWRYSVSSLEYDVRPARAVKFSKVLGYRKSFDLAVRAAESALKNLESHA